MKKNYFSTFFAALMLLVVMPATAQVSSIADLVGKYKFSADMEITAAGESFSNKFTNECEVTIDKDEYGYFAGYITGIAGLSGDLAINSIDVDANTITILSPNTYMGAEGLYLSDITGSKNIYTGDDTQYGDIVYTYDPTTKAFTLPDFSLVTKDAEHKVDDIVAKFTNVTLTFAEESTVADLSGEWNFVAEGETTPDWSMVLTATDESNKNYNISFKYGEFAPANLSATFNGTLFSIALNNSYLDADNKVYLADGNGTYENTSWDFELTNANELTLIYGIAIMQKDPSKCLEWYQSGTATRSGAEEENPGESEEEAFTWVGTYTVTAEVEVLDNTYEYPETGEMEIAYDEDYNEYYVAKLFGEDLTGLWYYGNGIVIVPSAEQANKATINTIGAHGESIYLRQIESGLLLKMVDADGGTNPLNLEINEDGTISMDNFKVMVENNTNGSQVTPAAIYKNITIVKTNNDNAVESVIVENKAVMGIFDLLGRKLDAITGPGLYIVNGKKVVIK